MELGNFDKTYQRGGSQINEKRGTERPDLLKTGVDAAVAAKTTGHDSPVQPHSGTIGITSFTCKEGGEKDEREVDCHQDKSDADCNEI